MAKETSSQLAERAINLRSQQGAFERELEKKVKERADFNKDLISQLRNIEGSIVAAPAMRSELAEQGVIRNPLAQEAVLARRRGSLGSQLGSISDLLGERRGRQSDVVRMGLQDLMSEADRLTALAQLRAQEEAARRGGGGFFAPPSDTVPTDSNILGDDLVIDTGATGGGRIADFIRTVPSSKASRTIGLGYSAPDTLRGKTQRLVDRNITSPIVDAWQWALRGFKK